MRMSKKGAGLAAAMVLLACCGAASPSLAAGAAVDPGARTDCPPLKVANAFFDRIAVLDLEGSLALLDDNLQMQDPWGRQMTKSQLRDWYVEEFPKLTKQRTTRTVGVTCEGERVAIEKVSERKLTDGGTYKNYYHFLFVVHNGKITIYHQYLDTSAFTDAVKMAPK